MNPSEEQADGAEDLPADGGPSAPSVLPPDDLDDKRVTWPTVIGVTALLYAGLSILGNGCGIAGLFFSDVGLRLAGIEVEGGISFPPAVVAASLAVSGLGIVFALLLASGGIAMIGRRASAMRLLKTWIVASILLTVTGVVIGFLTIESNVDLQSRIQDATVDLLRENGQAVDPASLESLGLAKTPEDLRRDSRIGILTTGLLPLVYPVFLGFFLTSRKRLVDSAGWE